MCKNTSCNQHFLDNAILNYELMEKIGRQMARTHDNALTFSILAQKLANHYDLYDFVSGRLTFMYAS